MQGRRPVMVEQWGDATASRVCRRGTPPPTLDEAGRSLPWSLQRENSPADSSISDCWPPELGENIFSSFEATQFVMLCHGGPGDQTQKPRLFLLFPVEAESVLSAPRAEG